MTKSKSVTVGLFAVLGAMVIGAGCSGPQSNGEQADGCPSYAASMTGAAISEALLCQQEAPTDARRDLCVQAMLRADELTPEGVGLATSCVLEAQERSDGAVVADALYAVSSNPEQTRAMLNAMVPNFDESVHGNTFGVALSRDAQTAIGGVLADLDEAARDQIVNLALNFALEPLSGYCAPYVQARGANDPAVQAYAGGINQAAPLNDTERWVLAATGEWDGEDVFDCVDGEVAGCAGGTDSSAIELLAFVTDAGGPQPPSRALEALRLEQLTPEEAAALTRFLSNVSYGNRGPYMNAVMGLMNNPERPLDMRFAMAEAAGEMMCDFERARTYTRSAMSAFEDRQADSPWNRFLQHCTSDFWGPAEDVGALARGSWLHASDAVMSGLREDLAAETAGWTCDQYLALNSAALANRDTVPVAGLGVVEVAVLAGEACADRFEAPVREVLEDGDAHPEARLAAVAYFLDLGDDSGCRRISSAMNWYDNDLLIGPSPEAEAMRDALEPRCH